MTSLFKLRLLQIDILYQILDLSKTFDYIDSLYAKRLIHKALKSRSVYMAISPRSNLRSQTPFKNRSLYMAISLR